MTSSNPGPEDQLTRSLSAQADAFAEHGGAPVELSSVLARAGEIRRGRRMRASIVMAAAVLAVAVPVAITSLDGGPDKHAPIATSPTPTPTPTVPAGGLARIPLGARPDHSYVDQGVVHNSDGSTQRLPAGSFFRIAAITPYLGGYLIASSDQDIVTLYDGANKAVKSGRGSTFFATTSDGVETAYVMNGRLFSNPGSGMASGDGAVGPVGVSGRPVGYLQQGLLYATGKLKPSGAPELVLTGGASVGHDLDSLTTLTAADDINDRVAGLTGSSQGRVISVKTHRTLWSSPDWMPVAFDYSGKYVAAVDISTQGASRIAILDAATGAVIASADLSAKGLTFNSPVFDDSDNVLVVAQQQDDGSRAILRLTPAGQLDRATRVVGGALSSDNETPLVIPTGPQ